jgi:leucyl aminopeptidase
MTDTTPFAAAAEQTVQVVLQDALEEALNALPEAAAAHARSAGFKADAGETLLLPAGQGAAAVIGAGAGRSPFEIAAAAMALPEGDWALAGLPDGWDPTETAVALAFGGYQFTRYKAAKRNPARFVAPAGADADEAARIVRGAALTRDLVNTPASDMLPSDLEAEARRLADAYGAKMRVTTGEDLLNPDDAYPMIHAVGRASADAPRLIEFEWGDPADPRLALVGKGVCFDSGGLDIKPADGMLLMKKDMGGAANVLGLASIIMDAQLPVRLHVLIPAVENAISGNAFRPGDILDSRKGDTVEIGNTDAEGRLVLADALTKALESQPELLIDMATLTGAARIALGPEVSPFYTDDDALAGAIAEAGAQVYDPVWRMPLWDGYDEWLDSPIADLSSTGGSRFAGSITAALFLRRFAGAAKAWVHFDIFAWNPKGRPGRPQGGEMLGARALWRMLKQRYGG